MSDPLWPLLIELRGDRLTNPQLKVDVLGQEVFCPNLIGGPLGVIYIRIYDKLSAG